MRAARKAALQKAEALASIASSPPNMGEAKTVASLASSALRRAVRKSNMSSAVRRDELLHSVLSLDPSKLYSAITKAQSSSTPALHSLSFGDHTNTGHAVLGGFNDTLSALKVPNIDNFSSNPKFIEAASNLEHILDL